MPEKGLDFSKYRDIAEGSPITGYSGEELMKFYGLPEDLNGLTVVDMCSGLSDLVPVLRTRGSKAFGIDIGYGNLDHLFYRFTEGSILQLGLDTSRRQAFVELQQFDHPYLPIASTINAFKTSLAEHPDWYLPRSAHETGLEPETVDYILSFYGIFGAIDHNLKAFSQVISEALRILKPEGEIQIGPVKGGPEKRIGTDINMRRIKIIETLRKRGDVECFVDSSVFQESPNSKLIIRKK